MAVLVDTNVLVAYANPSDPRHADARRLLEEALEGRHGIAATLDHVVAEGLTFLRRRPGRRSVSEAFSSLFDASEGPPFLAVLPTTPEDFERATRIHFDRYERALAFTDCLLVAAARKRGAAVLTFDEGFDGEVEIVR